MNAIRTKRKYPQTNSSAVKTRVVAVTPRVPRNVVSNEKWGKRGKWFNTTKNYPLPDSTIRTLKYCGQFSINAGIGSAGGYTFSANGIWDPDISGTGHQPYGFDQLMAMYNHYEVLESCIRVTPFHGQIGDGFVFGVKLDDTGSATTTAELLMEMPQWSSAKVLGPYGNRAMEVYKKFDQKKFFASQDREQWGSAGNNPADGAFFVVAVAPVTSLQDLGSIPFIAEIEYRVRFHEPKELPIS